jgi:hypothetical protein
MMSDPLGGETNVGGAEQPLGPVDGIAGAGAAAQEEAAPVDMLSERERELLARRRRAQELAAAGDLQAALVAYRELVASAPKDARLRVSSPPCWSGAARARGRSTSWTPR